MSEVTNNTLNQQVYNVHSGDALLGQVVKVVCILLPRGLAVGGFSDRGDLLMIRYNDYKKNLPTWILDFYEHQFLNEPLLAAPHKVIATFVASDKSLLVPKAIYGEATAEKWMKKIHFVEGNEVISVYNLREDKANYLYAWPAAIKSLMTRYFTNSKILPLAAYQFHRPYKADCSLQCSITSDQVYATLYNHKKLYWHQVFNYQNAEEVAYHFKLLCRQHNIQQENMTFQCTVTNRGLVNIVTELSQYFPGLKDGSGNIGTTDSTWTPTIYLLQQLYACAL